MKNSIGLPFPTSLHSPHIPARCFIVHDDGATEVERYPFTLWSIGKLNESRRAIELVTESDREWCPVLFFPEAWPPGLIGEYLRSHVWQGSLLDL